MFSEIDVVCLEIDLLIQHPWYSMPIFQEALEDR